MLLSDTTILQLIAGPAAFIVIYGAVVLFVLWVRSRRGKPGGD